jgi:hypothetical protein
MSALYEPFGPQHGFRIAREAITKYLDWVGCVALPAEPAFVVKTQETRSVRSEQSRGDVAATVELAFHNDGEGARRSPYGLSGRFGTT